MTTSCYEFARMGPKTTERFWSKVDKRGPVPEHAQHLGECWIWTAHRDKDGYGTFTVVRDGKRYCRRAHRFSLELSGVVFLEGQQGLHRCDNPSCVRLDHLFVGSNLENRRDCVQKQRTPTGLRNGAYTQPDRRPIGNRNGARLHPETKPRGDEHWSRRSPLLVKRGELAPRAKLRASDIREIRRLRGAGELLADLAERFGITFSNVSMICRRQTWKHID